MILVRIDGKVGLDAAAKFIEAIVEDELYDPSYRIIVNGKSLDESGEVEKIRRDLARASSAISGFFAGRGAHSAVDFCFCREGS